MKSPIACGIAIATIGLASCDQATQGVAWDDPAGDVKPLANLPEQPRIDIVRVEAEGKNGALHFRVRLKDDVERFFGYTRPDGKKGGTVAARFYIDADNNEQTGGRPRWAEDVKPQVRGYEFEIGLQLGFRYKQGPASGTIFGDASLDTANVTDVQPAARFAIGRYREGQSSFDMGFKLPADAREVAAKTTVWGKDSISLSVPYEWLGLKAGDKVRLCFEEREQSPPESFSGAKVLQLR